MGSCAAFLESNLKTGVEGDKQTNEQKAITKTFKVEAWKTAQETQSLCIRLSV